MKKTNLYEAGKMFNFRLTKERQDVIDILNQKKLAGEDLSEFAVQAIRLTHWIEEIISHQEESPDVIKEKLYAKIMQEFAAMNEPVLPQQMPVMQVPPTQQEKSNIFDSLDLEKLIEMVSSRVLEKIQAKDDPAAYTNQHIANAESVETVDEEVVSAIEDIISWDD